MASPRSTFWLYIFLITVFVLLGLAYAFQWTALLRLPWPWFLIFIPPVIMFIGRDGNHSLRDVHRKKEDDNANEHQQ